MIKDNKLSNVIDTLQRLSSSLFSDAIQRKLILDNLSEGVFTVDPDLKITSLNKSAESITGISEEDALGKACSDLFPSSTAEDFCIIAKVLQNKKPLLKQTRHLRAGERLVPVLVSASHLEDNNGSIVGGVQSFQEIREIFHRQLILDSVTDGVFTVDRSGNITLFNRAAELISGFSQEEVLGRPLADILGRGQGKGRDEILALVKSVTEERRQVEECTYIESADRHILPINIRIAPLIDPDGKIIGGVGSFQDTTDIIQSRHILDSVADGVFTVDHDFRITSFNKAAQTITGFHSEEVMGKKCSDVFCGSVCGTTCPVSRALEGQAKVIENNIIYQGKQGIKIPVGISVTALRDEEGNVIGGVETFRDLTEILTLRSKISEEDTQSGISTKSKKMQKIMSVLPDFARSNSNILILGESGTGKELIATAIHRMSRRQKYPFVAVNSGALPDTLLESELFGYKAGAFTDAKQDKKGRFASAEKGTLFLDEIGDISSAMQVKLLRVLQNKTYEPLGANTPVKTDTRIIAATNKNLEEMVRQGTFREDLYYRLNVVKIELPPLRERMEDLPFLVEHFIKRINRQRNMAVKGVSEETLALLMRSDYPGNIRELENIIEYAFILCNEGLILPHHLPETIKIPEKTAPPQQETEEVKNAGPEHNLNMPLMTLEEVEKLVIIEALKRNEFKKMKTCRELGISKDTLRRKLKAYGDIDS